MQDIQLAPANILTETKFLPGQLGAHIPAYSSKNADQLPAFKLAVIGLDSGAADTIRHTLYQYTRPDTLPKIIDLGNLTDTDESKLHELIKNLRINKIIPILLGGDARPDLALVNALHDETPVKSWATVDKLQRDFIDSNSAHLTEKIQWHWIGVQKHLFNSPITDKPKCQHIHYRLGIVRHDMKEMEPVLRDCAGIDFNLCAVRSAEAPANTEAGPSGFYSEEICQLGRYAGLSDNIQLLKITGLNPALDVNNYSAPCAAQTIWYFIEALAQRKLDHPTISDRMTSYTVSLKDPEIEVRFVKSHRSGRWWIAFDNEDSADTKYLSCSHKDYLMACQNILPDRFLNAALDFHPSEL